MAQSSFFREAFSDLLVQGSYLPSHPVPYTVHFFTTYVVLLIVCSSMIEHSLRRLRVWFRVPTLQAVGLPGLISVTESHSRF
jgi:hypothetical protein